MATGNNDICGKVFFIMGAVSGIGRSVAEGVLARKGKVFFIDVQESKGAEVKTELAAKYGADNVCFAVADVTDRNGFQKAFNQAVVTFSRVDVMFNNAGILSETRPADVVSVNLLGTIYGTEIASAHMRKDEGGKGGRIINVSSRAAVVGMNNCPVYSATKHGVRAYTHSLALSPLVEERGLEYATILPDVVSTNIAANVKPGDVLFGEELHNETKDKVTKMEELVEAFFYLVCLERMNGATLYVTPGKKTFMKISAQEMGETYQPLMIGS